MILPAEPAVSSCLPLVVVALFSQSPALAFLAGWSRLATNIQTHKQRASGHTVWPHQVYIPCICVINFKVIIGHDYAQ